MLKRFLFILSVVYAIPVFAGEYEDALAKGTPTFLYLHTANCQYCKQVTPNFDKLAQNYKNICKFVSVDADSKYGTGLMMQYRARYVPYGVMLDAKKQTLQHVSPDCMAEYVCLEKELKQFLK